MESHRVRYEWAPEHTYVYKVYTYMCTHVHMSTYLYLSSILSIYLSIYLYLLCTCMSAFSYLWLDIYIVGLNQSLMDFYHRVGELNAGERIRRRQGEKSLWFYHFYFAFHIWVNKVRMRSRAWELESSNHPVLKKINKINKTYRQRKREA